MATEQTIENIQETFAVGLSGILKISNLFKDIWKYKVTRYSVTISILVPILSIISSLNLFDLITEIKGQMILFLPCILGFTIAGYSLVVGFVQSNMLEKISEPTKNSKFSLYQTMSSKFAMNIILQGISLTVAYLYHFISYFDKYNKLNISLPNCLLTIINIIGLSILTFCFVISLLLVIQIVVNIFNFSQLHHYFINMKKVRPETTEKQ